MSIHEALITAGCFVFVSLVLSVMLISQHLRYYTNPAGAKMGCFCSFHGSCLCNGVGGERKVVELLEEESKEFRNPLLEGKEMPELKRRPLWNFIRKPSALGRELLIIKKFGLVQYHLYLSFSEYMVMGSSNGTMGSEFR